MKPLKRHPDLIELSRDHHHSLSLCVRLLRMPSESHEAELTPHFAQLEQHFQAEERQFAPFWAQIQPDLRQRFERDHATLRQMMAAPHHTDASWNRTFAETLRDHARFEERELFPAIEPYLEA